MPFGKFGLPLGVQGEMVAPSQLQNRFWKHFWQIWATVWEGIWGISTGHLGNFVGGLGDSAGGLEDSVGGLEDSPKDLIMCGVIGDVGAIFEALWASFGDCGSPQAPKSTRRGIENGAEVVKMLLWRLLGGDIL